MPSLRSELLKQLIRAHAAMDWYFEDRGRFSGWAQSTFGRSLKRSAVSTALAVQSVADELGVTFAKQFRIGELVYLG